MTRRPFPSALDCLAVLMVLALAFGTVAAGVYVVSQSAASTWSH